MLGHSVATNFNEKTGFKEYSHDSIVDQMLVDHMKTHGISPIDAVKHFPVLARRQSLKRFLAHVELFKKTLDVPGDILELGVFRGLGLMTWANLLEAFAVGDRTKTVIGMDNWSGFEEIGPQDGELNNSTGKVLGGFDAGGYYQELESAINIFDFDRFIPWKPRIELVRGSIEQTLPHLLDTRPGLRFSLVHFDVDLYYPTKVALEAIWDHIPKGGVIVFDEYGIVDWPGESQAVDEFLAMHPNARLKTFNWTNTPGAYLVK